MQFKENLVVSGCMICETGLHIGGAKESIEIGGIDNIIMRDANSDLPFIPGSSLKGKMRTLMELNDPQSSKNIIKGRGKPCKCGICIPCKIFGVSADDSRIEGKQTGPTRLIVRDSFPSEKTFKLWDENEEIVRGAEVKYENTIDRITSAANPRPSERVPRGSEFSIEMIFSVYEEEDENNFKGVFEALRLLEDNYLGGSGTRGYGKIRFKDIKVTRRGTDYYREGAEEDLMVQGSSLQETLSSMK
ncbi:MAG: type III-A CRISPR-associated RAMP protein Csm3 [Methanobacteriales archaeon Met13]